MTEMFQWKKKQFRTAHNLDKSWKKTELASGGSNEK